MAKSTDKLDLFTNIDYQLYSDYAITQAESMSAFGPLKSETGSPRSLGIPGVNGAGNTIVVPTYSKLNSDVVPSTLRVMENPDTIQANKTTFSRVSFRKGIMLERYDDSKTHSSALYYGASELGNWWAMFQDVYGVYALSAGRDSLTTTTVATYTASFTSLTNFKAAVNTADVGTGTSTANVFFVNTTYSSGIDPSPAANSWNNMDQTNNLLDITAFNTLETKLINRGVYPAIMNVDGVMTEGYRIMCSLRTIAAIEANTDWSDHVMYADVRGEDNRFWKGQSKKVLKYRNFYFTPISHPMYELTGDTAIRCEAITDADGDTTHYKEELLVLGSQAFGFSMYEDAVLREQEYDLGFEKYLGIEVIYGMSKLQYVLNDGTRRDTSASVCCVVPA